MPMFRMEVKLIFCTSFLLVFLACTTTITKMKNPVFAIPDDSVVARLSALFTAEHTNLHGRETITNGKSSAQMEINIINGKNIPEDKDQTKALAHSIATEIKAALKDKDEYDTYVVLFVKEESSSGVTKKTWKGDTFKSTELRTE